MTEKLLETASPTDTPSGLVIPTDEDETEPFVDREDAKRPEDVALYHGEQLTIEEARRAVGSCPMRMVSIVGDEEVGKTTLLASIFELYQAGSFAGCIFAGTQTPRGFDRRCHPSRTASGNKRPKIPRTQFEEGLHFFHLALQGIESGVRTDLLFADRPGEQFEDLRKSEEALSEITELGAADVVLFLVDGDRLVKGKTRGQERHNAYLTARAIFEAGAIRTGTRVLVVLTKLDLARQGGEDGLEAVKVFEQLVAHMKQSFGSAWSIEAIQIASRSEDGSTPLGLGVDVLLQSILDAPVPDSWTEDPPKLPALSLYDSFAPRIRTGGVSCDGSC